MFATRDGVLVISAEQDVLLETKAVRSTMAV